MGEGCLSLSWRWETWSLNMHEAIIQSHWKSRISYWYLNERWHFDPGFNTFYHCVIFSLTPALILKQSRDGDLMEYYKWHSILHFVPTLISQMSSKANISSKGIDGAKGQEAWKRVNETQGTNCAGTLLMNSELNSEYQTGLQPESQELAGVEEFVIHPWILLLFHTDQWSFS